MGHPCPQQDNVNQGGNMNIKHFINQHVLTNHTPLAGNQENLQHTPSQQDTTSNAHQHNNPYREPDQDPHDKSKKSKLERISKVYTSYSNMRQGKNETAANFIERFQNTHSNLAEEGVSLPPYLLTIDLLSKSNLDQRAIKTALTSC